MPDFGDIVVGDAKAGQLMISCLETVRGDTGHSFLNLGI